MEQPTATSTPTPTSYSSPAELLGKIPITLFMKSGTLALDNGQLSFRTRRATVFEVPVAKVHSVRSVSRVGLELWHGETRYRFVPDWSPVHSLKTPSDAVNVAAGAWQLGRSIAADKKMRVAREAWIDVLLGAGAAAAPAKQ